MEIRDLTEKLADIREKLASIVEGINTAAGGEAFYVRIFLTNDRRIVGLVDNLKVNEYKILFNLTEDKLVDGKVFQKVSKKKIEFEKIRKIEVFKTISGKPLFIK
jgi:hypothetical protein